MCSGNDCDELVLLVDRAIDSLEIRRNLLQTQERLMQIINCEFARRRLFENACQSRDRRRAVKTRQFIIEVIQRRIWRGGSCPPSPDVYDEALARTWLWFSQKLCFYQPETASFVTWFNSNLRYKILDVIAENQHNQNHTYEVIDEDGNLLNPLETFPVFDAIEDQILLKQILELVQLDADRSLRNCRMQSYQHVNCQKLLLRICEAAIAANSIPLNDLAIEFGVPPTSLRQFYSNRCISCISLFFRNNKLLE